MNLFRSVKGVFVGSGSDGMKLPGVCAEVVRLTGKAAPSVLYVGTATYDSAAARAGQCGRLLEAGCRPDILQLTMDDTRETAEPKFEACDVIVVSGGNTLFAVHQWRKMGVDDLFAKAARRGAVLSGGSAGAIFVFDAGHSDSGDPESFHPDIVGRRLLELSEEDKGKWEYIRVPGLGILPGLMCPHYDKVQSNGVLRATDFDGMMKKHKGERGLVLDHWCALISKGDGSYSVFSPEGKEGSVLDDGSHSKERQGKPGLWILEANAEGTVTRTLAPASGDMRALLRPANSIEEDARAAAILAANPPV
jgi:dipeptidase E